MVGKDIYGKFEEIPEYLLELMKNGPVDNGDNFTIEDVAWAGSNFDLDTGALLKEKGQDPHGFLYLLISALVKGQQPKKNIRDVRRSVQKIVSEITGKKSKKGPIKIGDDEILLEVGVLYFKKYYESGMSEKGIEIEPLVKAILNREEYKSMPKKRNADLENLTHDIAKKFKKQKDLYLARATSDNDWDRNIGLAKFRKLESALGDLESIGISVDVEIAQPTRPAKPLK